MAQQPPMANTTAPSAVRPATASARSRVVCSTSSIAITPEFGSRTSPRIRTSRSPASVRHGSSSRVTFRNAAGPCSVPPARPTEWIGTPSSVNTVMAGKDRPSGSVLPEKLAAHLFAVALIEVVQEPVLPRVDAGGERTGADAGLGAPADLPVLLGDQVPQLNDGFRLEQRRVCDRLGPEEVLGHNGGVIRSLRVSDVVHH